MKELRALVMPFQQAMDHKNNGGNQSTALAWFEGNGDGRGTYWLGPMSDHTECSPWGHPNFRCAAPIIKTEYQV